MATVEPYEIPVLQTTTAMRLELEVILNKGLVMVLPTGVNKGTGLREGLSRLSLSARHVIGVGDAENDHAFLRICGSPLWHCAALRIRPWLRADVERLSPAYRIFVT